MPLTQEQFDRLLNEIRADLQSGVSNASEYLERLHDEDDWSFVIKAQALVEAALTEAILAKIDQGAMKSIVERLPLADDQIGKLAIAKELGIMPLEQRRFIRRLAELRNRLAHRTEYVNFKLMEYVADLAPPQLKEWQLATTWFSLGKDSAESWSKHAVSMPRITLFVAVQMIVTMLHICAVEAQAPRRISAAALETAEELFAAFAKRDDA